MVRPHPDDLTLIIVSMTAIRKTRDLVSATKPVLIDVDCHLVPAREAIRTSGLKLAAKAPSKVFVGSS